MGCHLSGTSSGVKMNQFYLGSDPFWARVCSVLDPQDLIKEPLNCVLQPLEEEKGRPKVDRR